MRFFKIFLASFLAFMAFALLCVIVLIVIIGTAIRSEKVTITPNAVLVLETGQMYQEQKQVYPLAVLLKEGTGEVPGLFHTIKLIENAAADDNIKGIYLKVNGNPNGFASTEELRNALIRFKRSKKFIYAYGEEISQNAYYLATVADKIYLNPKGTVDFTGFSSRVTFLKGTLEKLEIKPEIFYCGKFKSATEPLRETKMTDANRVQTAQFLSELYGHFLLGISQTRHIDTASLHNYADKHLIREAVHALEYQLVDGLKYDDEVIAELKNKTGLKAADKVNLVTLKKYNSGTDVDYGTGENRIAVIFAQGDIINGRSDRENTIASENYISEIRKARENKRVKAILFRINSGGGSALASEVIWRELALAKKVKPVVVSMGDYAASGGYYLSCMADSIFAQPNTLTGSIGVFGVMFNMQDFFKNKLGVTFDGVKTGQYADLGTVGRPLTDGEKHIVQNSIDTIYTAFKSRVITGRKLDAAIVDSIAQGRVWSGFQAQKLGLVDRIGGINDALACAARLAKLSSYRIVEYPEVKDPITKLLKDLSGEMQVRMVKNELGINYELYKKVKEVQASKGVIQAKMPFDYQF